MTERPPPPMPATIREKLNAHNPGDNAQPTVPKRNITFARRRLVLRPKISERRPYNAWKAVLEMIYATAIQETLFKLSKSEPLLSTKKNRKMEKERGGYMRGKMAAMTVKSNADKKLQTSIATNVSPSSVLPPASLSPSFPHPPL